jgi:hypothetical protein
MAGQYNVFRGWRSLDAHRPASGLTMIKLKTALRSLIALGIFIAVIACLSCNSREPVLATSASTPNPVIPSVTIGFEPAGVMGGTGARGTVRLGRSASAGGTLVTLQSGHAAVSVPPSVTVAAGSDAADFPVSTTTVVTDTSAAISASAFGAVATGSLAVWAALPTYFSAVSEEGGIIGRSGFRRFTPQNATFTASCSQSDVMIFVTTGDEFWSASFGAPRGTPFRPGTYEQATRTSFRDMTSPGIDVTGTGGCNTTSGRFVVHEVSLTRTGTVQRFWVTFEQYCDRNPAALRGEVRTTDIPRGNNSVTTCLVP